MDEINEVAICNCQDSAGDICGRVMTKEENDQDGMCGHCADSVWNEMTNNALSEWKHSDRVDIDYK